MLSRVGSGTRHWCYSDDICFKKRKKAKGMCLLSFRVGGGWIGSAFKLREAIVNFDNS